MHSSTPTPLANLSELHSLLTRRLAVIGDKKMREEAPDEQLRELQRVSEAITAWHETHRSQIPARLNHFLTQSSLQKALDWINESPAE